MDEEIEIQTKVLWIVTHFNSVLLQTAGKHDIQINEVIYSSLSLYKCLHIQHQVNADIAESSNLPT